MAQDESHSADEWRAGLWSRIHDLAVQDGVGIAQRHVCAVAGKVLDAEDVVVYHLTTDGRCEPAALTGPGADRLSEAEITLGEGPALEALDTECPVLARDLTSRDGLARWPVFAPFAVSCGAGTVSAFPVVMGAVVVGCLEVFHRGPVEPGSELVVDGLLLADAALRVFVGSGPTVPGVDPAVDAMEARWVAVHQATGVVAAQLGASPSTAFVRMRAHAYLTGTRLADVAADVLARKLVFSFGADPDGRPG
ncbi:GAF domain-containing protein [Saccharothrix mutabilis subsp. mutabilis]|uniref:GAF domain-containing protein n=1 Tax=Saccharothrix mutabilis subsp. mutabilis TaxID=66855 RepID=A0ABP3E2L6_9PSEU